MIYVYSRENNSNTAPFYYKMQEGNSIYFDLSGGNGGNGGNGGTGGNKNTTTMLVLHAQTGNAIVPSSIIISGKRSQNNDEKKRPVDRKDTQSTLGSESLNYPPNPFKTSKAQIDHGDLV